MPAPWGSSSQAALQGAQPRAGRHLKDPRGRGGGGELDPHHGGLEDAVAAVGTRVVEDHPAGRGAGRLAEAELAEVAGLGAGPAIDEALAEQQVAAGPVLGDLEVQAAFIDVGRRAADGQRGADPLQPGWAGDLDAAAVHAQDPPAGGQALEPDHDRIGAGLGQQPAALAVLVAEADLAGAGAGGPERAGDHVGHAQLAGQEGRGRSPPPWPHRRDLGCPGSGSEWSEWVRWLGRQAAGLAAGCPAGEAAVAVGACRVVSATVVPIPAASTSVPATSSGRMRRMEVSFGWSPPPGGSSPLTLRGAGHGIPSTPCRRQRELITGADHSRHEDCYAWQTAW